MKRKRERGGVKVAAFSFRLNVGICSAVNALEGNFSFVNVDKTPFVASR